MTADKENKVLADTNVLLYCFDKKYGGKHNRAVLLMEELFVSGRLLLSVQILNEFFWNVTRPRCKIVLPIAQAESFVNQLIQVAQIVPVDASMCVMAMDCVARHDMQYWDALLWAAAKQNGVPTIYTEDFQHDREIDGVRFINPFVTT